MKRSKIIFLGDSITQMGVEENGYISKLRLRFRANKNGVDLIGEGISGNKVYDLYLRLEEDVISQSPDVVIIYVGINDVWHKKLLGTGTDIDKFEKFYRAIIEKLQTHKSQVIVCTPSVIGEKYDGTNEQDEELDRYSSVIRKLAAEFKLRIVDLRNSFLEFEKLNNINNQSKGTLTTDGVHLNERGNELVADKMWEIIKDL